MALLYCRIKQAVKLFNADIIGFDWVPNEYSYEIPIRKYDVLLYWEGCNAFAGRRKTATKR